MLRDLKNFLASLSAPDRADAAPAQTVELATAVLLVEVMRADAAHDPAERDAVDGMLRRHFGLDAQQVQELLALAETSSRAANDYFAFTGLLNDRLDHTQKIAVVEQMWRVAYADGAVDAGENHVISKVAGLLHVTHGEYIAAKLHARQAAGTGDGP